PPPSSLFPSTTLFRSGLPLYVAVALAGTAAIYFSGGTPWVTAKGLAISSPALLTAGLAGAGVLWSARERRRIAGAGGAVLSLVRSEERRVGEGCGGGC